MSGEYLSEVRNELQTRSTRTTLDELKRRGMEQVRVIRSSQIVALIEQAVDRALERRGETATDGERSKILENSTEILREMLRNEIKGAHGPDSERVVQVEQDLRSTREKLTQRDAALQEVRARAAELDAELRVMKQRAQMGSPDDLLEELRALRKEIGKSPAVETSDAAAQAAGAIQHRIESLGAELTSQIERIGRKVGISATDETPVDVSNLFTSIPDLESNLDAVEAEERKGSDVTDALARMKSLRKPRPE